MYHDAKPVHQHLFLVHPKTVAEIKVEVEKILQIGFIYLIPLTDWVLNVIPNMNKHGMIWVCVDYQDMNHTFPKDNYLTSFIS